ncbi:MAG TPA: aspartate--tRNA ligase, partial [Bacteroidia bacterium]|nr:aspartate--tRNA ligase [Bacteroidia bacterium]
LQVFEGLTSYIFKNIHQINLPNFERISYQTAMNLYGNDKPDMRFEMKFVDLKSTVIGRNFKVFDDASYVVGIVAPKCANYTRKQLDELTDFVKRPQIGATGLVYIRCNDDGSIKSSIDKFYSENDLQSIAQTSNAKAGDLILILAGALNKTQKAMSELRLEMGQRLGLRTPGVYKPIWVVDFPLLEFNEEQNRFFAMHHPFTSPKTDDFHLLESNPGAVRANAYDLVINGVEIGGGSIRIHDKQLQNKMFNLLGFTPEEAQEQFGFLLNAFEFGAPPHGGIAFGLDRLCSMIGGTDSIRDFIAFPKNNAGRDVMIDAPSAIDQKQLSELSIAVIK